MKVKLFLAACVSAMLAVAGAANAPVSAECVRNGSFEAGAKHWKLADGWSVGRGFGRNGSGGLVFETDVKCEKMVCAEQVVDVIPGKIYDFEAWIDAPNGATVAIHYLDANGKRVGGIFSGARSSSKGWGRLWVRTKRLPANVRKVRLRPFVKEGMEGKACFDDISFKLHEVEPVTAICSSCYRDEAAPEDGKVTFFAGIDLDDSGCGMGDVDVVFSFDSPSGERVRRKADRFDGYDASVNVAQDDIRMGSQEVAVEVVKRGGAAIGRRALKFMRIAARPPWPVHFDRWRRTILNGKPFFPLAIYCGHAESNVIERVGKAPFNTLMAYHKFDWAMLDWCKENGLMAITYVGDLSSYDTSIVRRVSKIKDHPAMLAWLANDERPLAMMKQIMSRYQTVREADPGHPTWAVLYQVDQMRGYVGTCDAIGTDPYPIPHAPFTLAHEWVEKTRRATFGAMPIWQTIQIFDWAAYKTKAVPGTDVSKFRAPTLAEMKIMAWFQIAGGANALLMYSYNPLEKMSWRDSFEKKWAEVCECAGEIASVSDILLSVEEPPEIGDVPPSLAVRTWRTGGKAHVLLCNATGKSLKTSVPLGAAKLGAMRIVHGGGVSMAGDGSLAVDFPPEGYAFVSFERPLLIAHRGAGDRDGRKPEASKAAYSNAVATACDVVKLDVQRTRDGVIVMNHDNSLKRTMGWDVNIMDLDYAEIYEKGRYFGPGNKPGGPERIVRLDEALAIVKGIPQFWVDFKYFDPEFAENLLKHFDEAGIDRSRIMVATFSKIALGYFKEHHPQIRRISHVNWRMLPEGGYSGGNMKAGKSATRAELLQSIVDHCAKFGLYGVNMPLRLTTDEDVAFLHAHGAKWVSLYFVQNAEDARARLKAGADAYVTDYVSQVREGMAEIWYHSRHSK